jgi:hypothetical protein
MSHERWANSPHSRLATALSAVEYRLDEIPSIS